MSEIRPAGPGDVAAIEQLVEAAYAKYPARIGVRPLPMDDDYDARVERGEAFVIAGQTVDGVIVLVETGDYLMIDNVAVTPRLQGRGLGRRLLAFAEDVARERGYAEVRLYTNEKMT